jgi:hypothetical protein
MIIVLLLLSACIRSQMDHCKLLAQTITQINLIVYKYYRLFIVESVSFLVDNTQINQGFSSIQLEMGVNISKIEHAPSVIQ